jgi:hypothetical protein
MNISTGTVDVANWTTCYTESSHWDSVRRFPGKNSSIFVGECKSYCSRGHVDSMHWHFPLFMPNSLIVELPFLRYVKWLGLEVWFSYLQSLKILDFPCVVASKEMFMLQN